MHPPQQEVSPAATVVAPLEDDAASAKSSLELPQTPTAPPPYSVYSKRAKWSIVSLVMIAGIFSPLSANSYLPAIPEVANSLGITIQKVNLSVTVFMIIQAVSPSFWGSLCDSMGRRPVYLACFVIYIASCLGLAFTNTYWLLMLLRCVQAAGSASVVALGSGTVGDLAPPKERGGFMGYYSMGAMLGPCIGPLAGGLLSDRWDWHAIFFFLAAFSFVVFVFMVLLLPETLRSLVGDGSIPPRGILSKSLTSWYFAKHRPAGQPIAVLAPRKRQSINPFISLLLFREKDVALLLTWNAVMYSLFYAVITSTSSSLQVAYGLSESELGLCYLATGVGMIGASACNGPRLNRDYRIIAKQHAASPEGQVASESKDLNDLGNFPIEHARLRGLPYSCVMMLISTIIYGWTVDKRVHLSVPLICQFFVGFASMTQFTSISTLLVDLFPGRSASATAANNLARCLLGAGATAVIDPIISRMGAGWAFTMLSLICILFIPTLVVEWRYGSRFRLQRAERKEREEAEKAARD
ncbi:hypothetical protein JCM10207_006109 [Rhodosporidiobolus poonsookiae]